MQIVSFSLVALSEADGFSRDSLYLFKFVLVSEVPRMYIWFSRPWL